MIKLVYCITRNAGMTGDEFFHYWKNVHGPIGRTIPGLQKLVQSHMTVTVLLMRSPPCRARTAAERSG